jgi:hypothetical protein
MKQNTQNITYIKKYINVAIEMHNLHNETEAYNIPHPPPPSAEVEYE